METSISGKGRPDKEASYLYCVAESRGGGDLGDIGIAGSRVFTISCMGLSAVVQDSRKEIPEPGDKDGMKACLLVHQRVVEIARERFGTVLPLGFGKIIAGDEHKKSEEKVADWLRSSFKDLEIKLKKVEGKAEYGVQVFWDVSLAAGRLADEAPHIRTLRDEIKMKKAGTAFLYEEKLKAELRLCLEEAAARHYRAFYDKIKDVAEDVRIDKCHGTPDDRKMLLNVSCLLDDRQAEMLGEMLDDIAGHEGFSVRYTGPWPPYSFV
ncbi:MAG: GvpL/GvpF family gas vesicle protein [Deltaproteobacteria bacterium]|nr:GvpL/GvpF family gas vesicle protein [Deltaproteobacteria bacterium]